MISAQANIPIRDYAWNSNLPEADQANDQYTICIKLLNWPIISVVPTNGVQNLFELSKAKPGVLELCTGSAILSFAAEKAGLFPIPFDHEQNKSQPKVPAIKMDLAEDSTVQICCDLTESGSVTGIAAAIPCEMASRASEIPFAGNSGPCVWPSGITENRPYKSSHSKCHLLQHLQDTIPCRQGNSFSHQGRMRSLSRALTMR